MTLKNHEEMGVSFDEEDTIEMKGTIRYQLKLVDEIEAL